MKSKAIGVSSKARRAFSPVIISCLIGLTTWSVQASVRGVYVGGDFYPPANNTAQAKASGFNAFFLFALHIYANGDIYYNDTPIVQGGAYVGDASWGNDLAALRPNINRIEMVIGGWGDASFTNIKNLIATNGTGPGSILYNSFQALRNAVPTDAIQYDDEQIYDAPSAVTFGNLMVRLGWKVTFCPYTAQSFWVSVKSQLGTNVDAIYLQCYDGGAGNDPGSWDNAFNGFKVYPGLWGNTDTTPSVTSKMRNWQQTLGINGGFMWLNGGLSVDAFKWAQALAFGLEPLNGLIAEDAATNYFVPGFTGNEGFGFGDWTLSTTGGGNYISGDNPALFGIWNNTANAYSTASRSLSAPLAPGDSFQVQLQMNNLDNASNTNAFELQDSNGNLIFSYFHQGGDNADGHYTDATGTHAAMGFAYDFSKVDTFTFTLNTGTSCTLMDNSTGASVHGTLSGAAISQVTFLRANGNSTPGNGQDFKFNALAVYVTTQPALQLTPTNSTWNIQFPATPTLNYRLQRAFNLNGPWMTISTLNATFNAVDFTDTNSSVGSVFYRTVSP